LDAHLSEQTVTVQEHMEAVVETAAQKIKEPGSIFLKCSSKGII
jgi:hypothetical protein